MLDCICIHGLILDSYLAPVHDVYEIDLSSALCCRRAKSDRSATRYVADVVLCAIKCVCVGGGGACVYGCVWVSVRGRGVYGVV